MPVRSEADFALAAFVEELLASRGEVPHCGVEEVLSGRGLANLDAFAAHASGQARQLASAEVLAAAEGGDAMALAAAERYVAILAQFLADQALVHLPWGGIYLIGGMARAMAPHFAAFDLAHRFRENRRIDLLTTGFEVAVVEDDYAALTGCAAYLSVLPR
jgi:glucokinase